MAQTVEIGGIKEPDWERLLTEKEEKLAASDHWRRIANEMNDLQILAPSNGHALQRLVIAYLVYDRCSMQVGTEGLVTAAKAENPKSIDRLSIYYQAMREAERTAERLEKQLGLTPGNRGKVGKVSQRKAREAKADKFLNGPE